MSSQGRNTQGDENAARIHMHEQEITLHGLWLFSTTLLAKLGDHWFGKERKK